MFDAIASSLNAFIDSGRWLKVLLIIGGVMMLYTLWRVQRGENRVDFKDLLVEDGHASPTKCIQMGAFFASTWVFIVMADAGTLTEWYFSMYIGVWTGTRLATKAIDAHALSPGKQAPPTTVTMSVPAGQTAQASTSPTS